MDPILPFRPSIEPFHEGQNFLPASREELIRETERIIPDNSVPWMAGFTSEDGAIKTACTCTTLFLFELHLVILIITLLNFWLNAALAYDPAVLAELERDFLTVGHLTLNFTAENPAAVLMKIKDFYLGADGKFTKENFEKITRVINNSISGIGNIFFCGCRCSLIGSLWCRSYTRFQQWERTAPTEEFIFISLATEANTRCPRRLILAHLITMVQFFLQKKFYGTSIWIFLGVVHMDELQYIFSMPKFFPAIPKDPKKSDYKMMKYMTKIFTDFATEG